MFLYPTMPFLNLPVDSVSPLAQHLAVLAAYCLAPASPSGAEATSLSLCFQGQAQNGQPLDVDWMLLLGNRLPTGWVCVAHHHIP